jgi:hypothetical protein
MARIIDGYRFAAVIVSTCAVVCSTASRADDYDDARQAAAIMAGVAVCHTVVSENLRRILYSKMLAGFHTPTAVNLDIEWEIDALTKMSPPDRAAMCLAIADGDRPQPQDSDHTGFRVVIDSAQAACGAGEIMVSAYCAGGVAIRIDGTTGASCDGGAKAVILCAK